MISVIDYSMGNLASVYKAFKYIGADVQITSDPDVIYNSDAVVMPGVGAISDAMKCLEKYGLVDAISEYISKGKPFFGICLGMQMFFENSKEGMEDFGVEVKGLGILKGEVLRLPNMPDIKVPHMGWNNISTTKETILPDNKSLYFVHSYYVEPTDKRIVTATSFHGIEFTAAIEKDNILATQFHPEKSGDVGLSILNSWIKSF